MKDATNLAALAVAAVAVVAALITKADATHLAMVGTIVTGCFAIIQRRGDQQ